MGLGEFSFQSTPGDTLRITLKLTSDLPGGDFHSLLILRDELENAADTLRLFTQAPPRLMGTVAFPDNKAKPWPNGKVKLFLEKSGMKEVDWGPTGIFAMRVTSQDQGRLCADAQGWIPQCVHIAVGDTDQTIKVKIKSLWPEWKSQTGVGPLDQNPLIMSIAGHWVMATREISTEGWIWHAPQSDPNSSLARSFSQKNLESLDDAPLTPTGMAGDENDLFLAYPELKGKIIVHRGWKNGSPSLQKWETDIRPYGLALRGDSLWVIGSSPDANRKLMVEAYSTKDGKKLRSIILPGNWDGLSLEKRGPALAFAGDFLFAVDGQGPTVKAKAFSIRLSTGHILSRELEGTGVTQIAPDTLRNVLAIQQGEILKNGALLYDFELNPVMGSSELAQSTLSVFSLGRNPKDPSPSWIFHVNQSGKAVLQSIHPGGYSYTWTTPFPEFALPNVKWLLNRQGDEIWAFGPSGIFSLSLKDLLSL